MKPMNLFLQISKVDAAQRLVYGTLTEEIADKTGEVFDYESGKDAFIKWSDETMERSKGKSKGNLRAMHGKVAAGKFNDIKFDDALKIITGVAKVSDDQEWAKVEDGTYTGFSIGGDYAKRWTDPSNANLTRYTPEIHEVSLVDNPCVGTATFDVIKSDGSHETRSFKTNPLAEKTIMPPLTETTKPQDKDGVLQVWKASDGSTHDTKAEALKHEEMLKVTKSTAEATQPLADAVAQLGETLKAAGADGGDTDEQTDEQPAAEPPAPDPEAQAAADAEVLAAEEAQREAEARQSGEASGDKSITGKLKKGLCDVSRLACIIQDLEWLQGCMEYETIMEGDGSPNAGKLDDILKILCAFMMDVVKEETGEMFKDGMPDMDKAAAIDGLAKAGARNSKKDMETMAAAHDYASEIQKCMKMLGYGDTNDGESADKAILGAITKLHEENKGLTKFITEQAEVVKGMSAQIEQIANAPAPRRGVLKAVGKTADGVAQPADNATAPETTDPIALIKHAHQKPVHF